MSDPQPVRLRIDELECTVGNNRLIRALKVSLAAGQCLLLTGPNGSGKTTLLRTIAGLLRPTAGRILWRDDVLGEAETAAPDGWLPHTDAQWRARMLYQGHASGWKADLTVAENLRLQWQLDGIDAGDGQIDAALTLAGLAQRRSLAFAHLSAGQRRRLSLARISGSRRPLWLLDEPATALDDAGQNLLGALLDAHLQRRGSAIVATHQRLPLAGEPVELNLSTLSRDPSKRVAA